MKKTFTLLVALLALSVSSWATLIEWTASDLETVKVEMGYKTAPGESQTIKGITVTNNTCYSAGDYCHFFYDTDPKVEYCSFSMNNDGQLVFAPESGTLTSIVIHCNYEGPTPPVVEGSGWSFDDNTSQYTWSGNAASVVLKSNSSSYLTSGPITLIEFNVSGYVPAVKWDKSDLADIYVGNENGKVMEFANLSQTVKDITVTADASAAANEEEYNAADISGNEEYGGSIHLSGDGTLTFTAPEGKQLARIVITYNGKSESPVGMIYLDKSVGWSWDEDSYQITWSGDAASSVVLATTNPREVFAIPQIKSIAFTLAEAVDTRKVPDFKIYTNAYITEATIIKDMYGEVFEPGTSALPAFGYPVYVYEDFDGTGRYYTKYPSELGLEMTYSVTKSTPKIPNKDVIVLTQTTGDRFEFDDNEDNINFGDVEITISTKGNKEYQPASTTFTIHVIEGKATTRECVLSFADGTIVPDDYEFNMETGDEFVKLTLREKNQYHSVYAPSFSIWGSKNYYIASLAGEKTLRALTAGKDTFTVRYARYETGDENGEFRILEFPVRIKSSKPAMTSSLSLTSSPASSSSLVCNAEYDGTEQNLKIKGALTNDDVRYAMANYAYGSEQWKAALPNTISFELAAGEGDFSVTCQVLNSDYEVRVLIFGDPIARHYDNPTLETFNIHYNIATQKAVVIYVAAKSSPNNGPKRAPAAKQDAEPLAMLSALDMTATYPTTAEADPEHTGVYYSTHYNETQKYQLPVGTEAYVATVNGDDLNLTKVAEGGQVIPADNAFILKSTSESVILTPTDAEAVAVSAANDLIGTDFEKTAPANCYALSTLQSVGFYPFSGMLTEHKAYIIYSGSQAPEHMNFIFGENPSTGVDYTGAQTITTKVIKAGHLYIIKNGVYFNAQGQIVK